MQSSVLTQEVSSNTTGIRRPLVTSNRTVQLLLVILDFMLVSTAAVVALHGRLLLGYTENTRVTAAALFISAAACAVWMLLLLMTGAYRASNLGTGVTEYKMVWTASTAVATGLALAAYLLEYPLSRVYYVIFVCLGTTLLIAGRFGMRRVLYSIRRRGSLTNPVLVVGNAANTDEIVAVLRREPWLGYDVIGVLTPDLEQPYSDIPVLGTPADVVDIAVKSKASAVIFTEGAFPSSADFRRMAWKLEDKHTDMIIVPALTDVSAERLDIRPVAGLPLVHVDKPQAAKAGRSIKRIFDIVGSLILIILSSPLVLISAILIKLEDGGPIFFKQLRTGRNGEPFYCYKLRSMCTDAEARKASLAHLDDGDLMFRVVNDPRVTRIGRVLRNLSIDEIPQFYNVLIGDMSLVGPRPALPSEVAQYSDDAKRRLQVRPGVSGLWQVSGRSDLSWEETVRLDLYYVDNWSLLQDLNILRKTLGAVIEAKGAY